VDGTGDDFLAVVDQMLSCPNARQLLEDLTIDSENQFQSNFAAGFAYRVRAVAPGISPSVKAELYRKAADAFGQAARKAMPSVQGLAEARHFEHEAFALITEAGLTAEPYTRVSLYERSCAVLDQALSTLPVRYRKTRSHLLGWRALCQAKANGIRADQEGDVRNKSAAHEENAYLFAKSAEHYREAGQESLAQLSVAWQSFSAGWSSYFGGDISQARDQFRRALAIFEDFGRSDLLTACLQCLQPIGMELGPLSYEGVHKTGGSKGPG